MSPCVQVREVNSGEFGQLENAAALRVANENKIAKYLKSGEVAGSTSSVMASSRSCVNVPVFRFNL